MRSANTQYTAADSKAISSESPIFEVQGEFMFSMKSIFGHLNLHHCPDHGRRQMSLASHLSVNIRLALGQRGFRNIYHVYHVFLVRRGADLSYLKLNFPNKDLQFPEINCPQQRIE